MSTPADASEPSSANTEVPTHCTGCGQRLYLLAPGRDRCERCRLGRSPAPETTQETGKPKKEPVVRPPCTGCGRTQEDAGYAIGTADGYCLSCRVEGRHLA